MARQLRIVIFPICCVLLGLLLKAGALPPQSSKISRTDVVALKTRAEGDTSSSAAFLLRDQLKNPAQILAVLLIIGGDIIQKACAQLSCGKGRFFLTPVAFSFGWVAYAFGALVSACGDGSLMPSPDISSIVATVGGQWKTNESWVLGRLVRDLEFEHERGDKGLRVVFYKANGASSRPHRNRDWTIFFFCIVLQFGVAAVPLCYNSNWYILMITAIGTFLALVSGSLPQWRKEKYSGEPKADAKYVLTRGNGHVHAFVIQISPENKNFINLDHLAVTRTKSGRFTRVTLGILAVSWIILLITVGGMKQDTWFLFLVGLFGMVQNVLAAGLARQSTAHGIPLTPDDSPVLARRSKANENVLQSDDHHIPHFVDRDSVMEALKLAEMVSAGAGLALLPLLYPAGLRSGQVKWWTDAEESVKARKREEKQAEVLSTAPPRSQGAGQAPDPTAGELVENSAYLK